MTDFSSDGLDQEHEPTMEAEANAGDPTTKPGGIAELAKKTEHLEVGSAIPAVERTNDSTGAKISGAVPIVGNPGMVVQFAGPAQFEKMLADQDAMRKMVMEYVAKNLVAGTDFGKAYKGSDKDTLLKPGAEKVASLLRTVPRFEKDHDTAQMCADAGVKGIFYVCHLMRGDVVVAEGRGAVHFVGNWKDKNGIIHPNKFEKFWDANNAIKMAEKRSQVDAVLRLATLSDVFTQDMESYDNSGSMEAQSESVPTGNSSPPAQQARPTSNNRKGMATDPMKKKIFATVKGLLDQQNIKHKYDEVGPFIHFLFSVQSGNDITFDDAKRFFDTFSTETYGKFKNEVQFGNQWIKFNASKQG